MTEIKFNKNALLTSVILCVAAIAFSLFMLFREYNIPAKIVFALITIVFIYVLLLRAKQLYKSYNKEKNIGLQIDDSGLLNNTQSHSLFINWNEITGFEIGFYRTRQIHIKTIYPGKYPRKKYFGLYLTSKPEILWIDVDILDIKRGELLSLLNEKLIAHT